MNRRKSSHPRRDGKEERFMFRDHGLADVSPEALQQLANLLRLEPGKKPDEAWLRNQKAEIENCHADLRIPSNLLKRMALKINQRQQLPYFPQMARLCPSHEKLDARMIRNLTYLVGSECTRRTDRWRQYRDRQPQAFPQHIKQWLERVDSIMTLWVGQKAFKRLFGYKNVIQHALSPVESGCEACLLSCFGGCVEGLGDLRVNMLERMMRGQEKEEKRAKEKKRRAKEVDEPRLLKIVEAWMAQLDPQRNALALRVSEDIAGDLHKFYLEWQDRKDERRKEERRKTERETSRRRHSRRRRGSGLGQHEPEGGELPTTAGTSSSLPRNQAPGLKREDATVGQFSQHGIDTYSWVRDRVAALPPEEREEVMSQIHPALSEAAFGMEKTAVASEWEGVSVFSIDDPHSPYAVQANKDAPSSDSDDSKGNYTPPRRFWNKEPEEEPEKEPEIPVSPLTVDNESVAARQNPPRPAASVAPSSFYSDHPGFPRNHRVTTLGGFRNPILDKAPKVPEEDEESRCTEWFPPRKGM